MLEGTRWEAILILGWGSSAFGWLMARYININKFSLQGMYRNRLIRAYLGASNAGRRGARFYRVRAKRQHPNALSRS